ncbi:hypothetical protein K461DRAFT_274713 [Myriangium duriaei CBS 260.36]|uniref:Rho-GAP domain-containing protein n=1 Tax=Myriangium duriaei CBS 260.36 TaxID=1168546 RepID=A0A9P4MQK4_9PEZI|nr:hypothetical protein K461DRAFT_274713 [Myriangium duriaei CBS 260.36]
MKSAIVQRAARLRSNSLRTVPPPQHSDDYDEDYASRAAAILYRSPLPSPSGLPLYILNAAAFPDAFEIDYDALLPYVLARLPEEDDLIAGAEYEVVFFAGGQPESVTGDKKSGPGVGWYIQVYQVLSRALRKRLQKIWIVHERSWVRVLTEVFGTIVSPKFKRKIVHVNTLGTLAMHLPIEELLIPPAVYLHDRKLNPDIYVPYASGRRAFGANEPFPRDRTGASRLPRVLREASTFLLMDGNIKSEGLFRIPPHSVLLGVLREAYDRGQRFIVWKERKTTFSEPGIPGDILAEVHDSDAYGVHFAAGLIKVWYRELRNPVFPEKCYPGLRKLYQSPDTDITLDDLIKVFSPRSDQSFLPQTSRMILTWHLFPLLAAVSSQERFNKMSPDNLAVCFAPALICGADQLQDAKMTTVLRQVVAKAVTLWTSGLREACGRSDKDFYRLLEAPNSHRDYEDPLTNSQPDNLSDIQENIHRIQLHDTAAPEQPPALPPRSSSLPRGDASQPQMPPLPKRKPAPSVSSLPRYSTIVNTSPSPVSPPSYSPNTIGDHKDKMIDQQNGFSPEKPQRSNSAQLQQSLDVDKLSAPQRPSTSSGVTTPTSEPVSPMLAPSLAEIQGAQLRSVSGDSTKSNDDGIFMKPLWAASSRQASTSSAVSYRKPTPPLNLPKNTGDGQGRVDSGAAPTSYNPKPRAPSPGLMQRMQSWEKEAAESNASSRANSVDSRKQSVDDLRRLYEERVNTIASMPPMVRTKSNASTKSNA